MYISYMYVYISKKRHRYMYEYRLMELDDGAGLRFRVWGLGPAARVLEAPPPRLLKLRRVP